MERELCSFPGKHSDVYWKNNRSGQILCQGHLSQVPNAREELWDLLEPERSTGVVDPMPVFMRCAVNGGTHIAPYWCDLNTDMVVCSRHKKQMQERPDLGPYDWHLIVPGVVEGSLEWYKTLHSNFHAAVKYWVMRWETSEPPLDWKTLGEIIKKYEP